MTLKELSKFFAKNKIAILGTGVSFALVGVVIYFLLPPKYSATGTLFVTRKIEQPEPGTTFSPESVEDGFFSYEGYYAQQNALSYTSTLIGLIESADIKSKVLDTLSISVSEANLRKLGRAVSAKKHAPQLVVVTVKGLPSASAEKIWTTLVDEVMLASQKLSEQGDPNLVVVAVSDHPIVKEGYRNVLVNIIIGFGFGVLVSTMYFAGKQYFS